MRSARQVALDAMYRVGKAELAAQGSPFIARHTFEVIVLHDDSDVGKSLRRNLAILEEVIEADRKSTIAARAPS